MSTDTTEALSVIIEREIPHSPEKVWRALTEPQLIEAWLMKTDFRPVAEHRFQLRGDWGTVECQVLRIEPNRVLSYSWAALGVDSIVTFTLSPTAAGTQLRMEQRGFRADQQQAWQGARYGWPRFLAALEEVLARPA